MVWQGFSQAAMISADEQQATATGGRSVGMKGRIEGRLYREGGERSVVHAKIRISIEYISKKYDPIHEPILLRVHLTNSPNT
jgi:hypothetical protein